MIRCELWCLFWILISKEIAISKGAYSAAKETEIRSETVLAASYDAISRPVAQTVVSVGLSLLAIDELDLKNQKFTTAGWLTFEWTDSRATWTPAAKDNIESIFAAQSTIWKPEVVVDNSLEDLGVISDTNLQLRVDYTGLVEWEPLMLFTTHCEVDITFYPYDQQKCAIEVVSWGYTYDEVKLEALRTYVDLEDFEQHGEWEVDKSEIEIRNLTETTAAGVVRTHPQVDFVLYLVRRTTYYNLNVMVPIVLTSLLVILAFIVPVESGEKLSYVLTVFLSLAVLLTLVTDSLPSTSITTSVLGLYLGIVLILASLGCFLTVLILIMFHMNGSPHPSSIIMVIVRFASKITCIKLPSQKVSRPPSAKSVKVSPMDVDDDMESVPETNVIYDVTWTTVAMILDRFCFIIFLCTTLATNFSFIVALVAGGLTQSP